MDKNTLNTLYDSLFLGAMNMLHDVDEAMDVVQDVFEYYYSNISHFDEVKNIQGYLYGVMRNKCINLLRIRGREVSGVDLNENISSSTSQESAEELLSVLTPWGRKIVRLHDIEGYTCEEIAQRLHCSVAAVRKQLTRSRKKLLKSLKK